MQFFIGKFVKAMSWIRICSTFVQVELDNNNGVEFTPKNARKSLANLGGSPGLVVKGGNW